MLRKSFLFIALCLILSLLLTACGGVQAQDKTYTIGVVNYVPVLTPCLAGYVFLTVLKSVTERRAKKTEN